MKAKEYREKIRKMSVEELRAEEQELKAQLFKLRFKGATSPVDNPVQVRSPAIRWIRRSLSPYPTA